MSPVGASIFSPRASMWNRVDPGLLGAPFSIIFALDSSGSMNTGTRLADLKTSVTAVLEDLKPFVGNVVANVGVTVWADTGVTDHRLDADAADIDELITFVNGIVAGTGGTAGELTQFHMAFEGAADFYEASSAPEASRIMFFVTDGVATGDSASTAVGLRDAIDDILVFGFNINLTDISDTELVDNTPEDGVPVIEDGDPGAMVLAMEAALGGAAAAPTSEILFTVEPDASAVFLPDAQSSIWAPDLDAYPDPDPDPVFEERQVFFRAASTTVIANTTNIQVTIPNDAIAGDMLVATVMHRSSLAIPAGWELVITSPPIESNNISLEQFNSVLTRIAQPGDAGSNAQFTQAESGRLIGHIQAFNSVGEISVAQSGADSFNEDSPPANMLPALTATSDMQIASTSQSFIFAIIGGTATTITAPSGHTLTSVATTQDNRLGVAYKMLADSETLGGRFNSSSGDTTTDTAVTAIILEAFEEV